MNDLMQMLLLLARRNTNFSVPVFRRVKSVTYAYRSNRWPSSYGCYSW